MGVQENILNLTFDEYIRKSKLALDKIRHGSDKNFIFIKDIPNGITIIKDAETGLYDIYHTKYGVGLGHNRKSVEKAIADIPYILRSLNLDIHNDVAIKKHMKENFDWIKNSVKQNLKWGGKAYRWHQKISGKKVLDVGGGHSPDVRATDVIDLQTIPNKLSGIKYVTGINLDKQKMPYTANIFDTVLSYGAVGHNFGTILTFNEMYRVLKQGGILEIGVASYLNSIKGHLNELENRLKELGIKSITIKTITMPNKGNMIVIQGRK